MTEPAEKKGYFRAAEGFVPNPDHFLLWSAFGEINSLSASGTGKWSKPTTTLTGLTWEFNQGIKMPQGDNRGDQGQKSAATRGAGSSHRRQEQRYTAVHALRSFGFSGQRWNRPTDGPAWRQPHFSWFLTAVVKGSLSPNNGTCDLTVYDTFRILGSR